MVRMIHDEARGTMLEDARFEETVRTLADYHDREGVLSVYLDIEPSLSMREGYEAVLMQLFKPLAANIRDAWLRGRLEYEVAGVTSEVRSWSEPPARSVAMFFSGPGGLRTILPLSFPIQSVARFEPRPVLAPLIAALDEHRRYCVVLFDKAEARLLTVFLGQVEEESHLQADVLIGRSSVGGWGGYLQGRYERHREHHLAEHARRTVEHLWAIDKSRPIHALILGGPPEALGVLKRQLPRALARSVVATLPVEMFASNAEVLKKVAALEQSAREREDEAIVEKLIGDAAVGEACLGWPETLQALVEGRVHMLLLRGGAAQAGFQCPDGHFVFTRPVECCPTCEQRLVHIDDVAEGAIRLALHSDAVVRYLAPRAGERMEQWPAAAVLRF
jgi:peptide subunit release factor 1 (eRF1)